jgi:hypothetical protein
MAAPYVSGVLALLLSFKPNATPYELINAIRSTTQPSSHTNIDIGVINALAAIQALSLGARTSTTASSCLEADLSVETDEYGSETAYRLRRMSDGAVLWKGKGLVSNREYIERECLDPNDCYEFIILDSYGDGIMGKGILLIYDDGIQLSGGKFGKGGYKKFGGTC